MINRLSAPKRLRARRFVLTVVAVAFSGAAFVGLGDYPIGPTQARAETSQQSQTSPTSFAPVIEKVSPAVVSILVTSQAGPTARSGPGGEQSIPPGMEEFLRRFFGDDWAQRFGEGPRGREFRYAPLPERPVEGAGSGFIVDPEGYIVTNDHVVQNASKITVVLHDERRLTAELVGRDELTDLVLLKVEANEPLPHVEFSKSAPPRVGDWVVTIGNPFGLGHTVTAGIVSAHHRNIGSGPYDDYIQIDAPINRGNSGGPTFNTQGEVIGVNTAIFSPTGGSVGIGFAIPSSTASHVIAELKSRGEVERGWLGVQIQNINEDIAESLGLERRTGAIVAEVTPGSPAARANIRQGDVIVRVNDEEIDSARDLAVYVATLRAGDSAEIEVLREGKTLALTAEIQKRPTSEQLASAPQQHTDKTVLGMELSALDEATRRKFGIEEGVAGVVITGLKPDSVAAARGLSVGDVIKRVAEAEVSSPADVEKQISNVEKSERKTVLLLVHANNQDRFVALPVRPA